MCLWYIIETTEHDIESFQNHFQQLILIHSRLLESHIKILNKAIRISVCCPPSVV